jgi:hypothetical protein
MGSATVFIHVGMHKTGTTAIQQFLIRNHDALAARGIASFVPAPQINAKVVEAFDPVAVEAMLASAERKGLGSAVFSAEVISTFTEAMHRRLLGALGGRNAVFIAWFRHWSSFLPSRWAQNCKRRDAQSFQTYLALIEANWERHIEARFDLVVERILAAGAREMRVVSYDNAVRGPGLIRAFLDCLSGELADLADDLPDPILQNARLDPLATETLRFLNAARSASTTREPNELFFAILENRRIREIYDFDPKLENFRGRRPDLAGELAAAIKGSMVDCTLTSKRASFQKWEASLRDIAAPFTVNPDASGALFPANLETTVQCSPLEWADLDPLLRRRLMEVVAPW